MPVGQDVGGVLHLERIEDALLDEAIDRHARRHFDDARQHVEAGGGAVRPAGARLELERHLADAWDVVRQRLLRTGRDRAIREVAVGAADHARRVRENVADLHLALNRNGVVTGLRRRAPRPPCAPAAGAGAGPAPRAPGAAGSETATVMFFHSGMNFEIGSCSRTLPSSIIISVATPMTGLVIDMMREDAVLDHRLLGFQVHRPERFVIADAAVARDQRHRAREAAGGDVPLHELGNPLQAVSRETDFLGFCRRRRGCERPRQRQTKHDDETSQGRSQCLQHVSSPFTVPRSEPVPPKSVVASGRRRTDASVRGHGPASDSGQE